MKDALERNKRVHFKRALHWDVLQVVPPASANRNTRF